MIFNRFIKECMEEDKLRLPIYITGNRAKDDDDDIFVSVLSIWQSYKVVLLVAVMIGFGKGLRTVFMALVIPTHVPLHKLPGASGIQLVTAGMVYLTLGPFVGENFD